MKVTLNLNSYSNMETQPKVSDTNPQEPITKPLDRDSFRPSFGAAKRVDLNDYAKKTLDFYKENGWLKGYFLSSKADKLSENTIYRIENYRNNWYGKDLIYNMAGHVSGGIVNEAISRAGIEMGLFTQKEWKQYAKNANKIVDGKLDNDPIARGNERYKDLVLPHLSNPEFVEKTEKYMAELLKGNIRAKTPNGETDYFTALYNGAFTKVGLSRSQMTLNDFHGFFLPMMAKDVPQISRNINDPFMKKIPKMIDDEFIHRHKNPRDNLRLYQYEYKNFTAYTLVYDPMRKPYYPENTDNLKLNAYIEAFLRSAPGLSDHRGIPGNTVLMPKIKYPINPAEARIPEKKGIFDDLPI